MKQLGVLLLTSLNQIPVHPMVTPTSPPPLAFHQASLTNIWYQFILLGGEGHCEREVFCTRTKHIDLARLQMQTPKPWVHLTNHKATMSPQEGRVYAESFLISNKFYKTKVKFSYLIFKGDYWSKLIKYVFNSISSIETNAHICIDGC